MLQDNMMALAMKEKQELKLVQEGVKVCHEKERRRNSVMEEAVCLEVDQVEQI
jgi:hypothetical protein